MSDEEMRAKIKEKMKDPELAAMMDGKELDSMSTEELAAMLEKMSKPSGDAEAEKTLVAFGGNVKAVGDGRVQGYLVRYSTPSDPDLEMDFFKAETDFGNAHESAIWFNHRVPINYRGKSYQVKQRIGSGKLIKDDVGIFIEAVLDLRDEYEAAIYELAQAGKLGWSSGTAGHLVERELQGKAAWIKSWPLGLDASLTPTPAEPRNRAVSLKSLMNVPTTKVEETAASREDKVVVTEKTIETFEANNKETKMADENKEAVEKVTAPAPVQAVEIDYDRIISGVAKAIDAPGQAKSAPVVIKAENLGDPDPFKALARWAMGGSAKGLGALGGKATGENSIYFSGTKAALQEGTASEGGDIVPNDFYPQIVAKRDQLSIARQAGARVIQTSRDIVDIPYEDSSMSNFTVVAEEGAVSEAEPTFGVVQVQVYNFRRLIKISEELLEDEEANLDAFLVDSIGRAQALAENNYTLAGTGSSQPSGVFTGGSVGYTFADTNSITVAEIPALYFTLGSGYMDGAVWVTAPATLGFLQGLTGSDFQLVNTPVSDLTQMSLWNRPVFMSDSAPAMTTGLKSIIVGNWNYYGLVERKGMTISRNPYLYQANGQVGLFASYRMGGAVLQSEAFKWGIQA